MLISSDGKQDSDFLRLGVMQVGIGGRKYKGAKGNFKAQEYGQPLQAEGACPIISFIISHILPHANRKTLYLVIKYCMSFTPLDWTSKTSDSFICPVLLICYKKKIMLSFHGWKNTSVPKDRGSFSHSDFEGEGKIH